MISSEQTMSPATPQPVDAPWIRSVVDQYEGPLVRYATRILGDVERARDVAQDTFLRLCNQSRSEVEGRLAEWLFTVCRNRALDVRRKEERMRPMTEAAQARPGRGPEPAQALMEKESSNRLFAALARLPKREQEILRLKFQEGLSYKEISGVMQLTVSNVGWLIHTGLKTIQRELAADRP